MGESGSSYEKDTETSLVYQPLSPSVPVTIGVMIGGVVSPVPFLKDRDYLRADADPSVAGDTGVIRADEVLHGARTRAETAALRQPDPRPGEPALQPDTAVVFTWIDPVPPASG